MAFQIIIVVEADENSRSDYIYIKNVLDRWFNYRLNKDVKITPIFMGGKGNYNKRKVVNKIKDYTRNYQMTGITYTLYCFDTDEYDKNPDDKRILEEEEAYCRNNSYEFVWFCHDVEEVFLGKRVEKREKKELARRFEANDGIDHLDADRLISDTMITRRSNLLVVLNRIFSTMD